MQGTGTDSLIKLLLYHCSTVLYELFSELFSKFNLCNNGICYTKDKLFLNFKNAIPLPFKLIYCLWIGLIFDKCFDFKLLSSIFAAKSIYHNLQQICCQWALRSLTKICIIWIPSSTNTQTSNWLKLI